MFKSHIKVWHSIQLSNDVEVDIQIVQIQCESGIEAGTLKLEIHNEFWQRLTEISELEKRVSGAKICTKKRDLVRHIAKTSNQMRKLEKGLTIGGRIIHK